MTTPARDEFPQFARLIFRGRRPITVRSIRISALVSVLLVFGAISISLTERTWWSYAYLAVCATWLAANLAALTLVNRRPWLE